MCWLSGYSHSWFWPDFWNVPEWRVLEGNNLALEWLYSDVPFLKSGKIHQILVDFGKWGPSRMESKTVMHIQAVAAAGGNSGHWCLMEIQPEC